MSVLNSSLLEACFNLNSDESKHMMCVRIESYEYIVVINPSLYTISIIYDKKFKTDFL